MNGCDGLCLELGLDMALHWSETMSLCFNIGRNALQEGYQRFFNASKSSGSSLVTSCAAAGGRVRKEGGGARERNILFQPAATAGDTPGVGVEQVWQEGGWFPHALYLLLCQHTASKKEKDRFAPWPRLRPVARGRVADHFARDMVALRLNTYSEYSYRYSGHESTLARSFGLVERRAPPVVPAVAPL
ncbi:unnamed protein product [Spodoptera exigua]|nr:unnamed protein product [Spodoptera exigua]